MVNLELCVEHHPTYGSREAARRVLVVDDERDTVMTWVALLHSEGFEARAVTKAAEVMNAVFDFEPDAMILDINLDGESGWDLAREIRRNVRPKPLLIGVSGVFTKGSDKILADLVGFDFYVLKPCDPQVLLSMITGRETPEDDESSPQ